MTLLMKYLNEGGRHNGRVSGLELLRCEYGGEIKATIYHHVQMALLEYAICDDGHTRIAYFSAGCCLGEDSQHGDVIKFDT